MTKRPWDLLRRADLTSIHRLNVAELLVLVVLLLLEVWLSCG